MEPWKSQDNLRLSFYFRLVDDVYQQIPEKINSTRELQRDLETIRARVEKEGFAFMTKALPQLGKALDRAFETGQLSVPPTFGLVSRKQRIPNLFRTLFQRVFSNSGLLLEDPCVASISDLRTLLFFFYKLEDKYSDAQSMRVLEGFVENEDILSRQRLNWFSPLLTRARSLATRVFSGFDLGDLVPGHGPGSVATKEKPEDKCFFRRKFRHLHEVFPYYEYFYNRGKDILSRVSSYKNLKLVEEPVARVILVPKDSRGPRLISCEPLEIMYIQQGLMRVLQDCITRSPLTTGKINFTDQSVNGNLARDASLSREKATLDLKDASDLVSNDLVQCIFFDLPHVSRALQASRSTHTELPIGWKLKLNKFAPMGSAVCFPVESFIFWALSTAAVQLSGDYKSSVYVYGDDIIVDVQHVNAVISALESVSLRVNRDKSFSEGFFRESCGVDAFKGHVVTPIRYRKDLQTAGRAGGILSLVGLANQLFDRCYYRASESIQAYVEQILGKRLPYTSSGNVSYLSWVRTRHSIPYRHTGRFNSRLQRWERRLFVPQSHSITMASTDMREAPELFRKITQGWSSEFRSHVYSVRGRVNLHQRWCAY